MEVSESVGNKEARCKGGHFCVVPGCGNEFYKVKQQGRVVHFHSVPLKRQDVFHRWLAALKLDGHLVRRGSRVCSEHFVEDDYLTEKVFESGELVTRPTNKLKVDAAPSVFDFSSQKVVYTSRPVHTLSTGKDLKLAVIHQKRARRQALLAEQKEDQQGVDLVIPQKKPATSSEDMDSVAPAPVVCKVCGTFFETRRGLSSHARLHLRQLGVTLSESSGAPIELLYQLVRERGDSVLDVSDPSVTDLKITSQQESRTPSAPEDRSESLKVGSKVLTTPQKMDHQGSPVRLKESPAPPLPSPSSGLRLVESRTSEGSSSSSEHLVTAKPMWAPLETDAPISLASDATNEVHVCQLCGCWYGTRKGLSGHARAHLRQIGIPDKDIKGSPTDFLYQLMKEEDLKPFKESTSNSTVRPSKRPSNQPSPPASPPSKRLKSSENFSCILCGEQFENRKGLGIHARAHLRQIGVGDLLGKTSAIDTIQELVSSGMLEPTNTPITNRTSSPSTAPSPEPIPSTSLSSSPPKLIQSPLNRAPKAKKGFRLAVDPLHRKPKPEPVEIELSVQPEVSNNDGNSPTIKSPIAPKPLTAVSSTDLQSPPTVLCDYCGQLFETRKALSCHARAHLRQLGLSWSIRTSPIDLLKEVMMRGEEGKKLPVPGSSGKATFTPQSSRRSLDSLQSGETSTNTPLSPLDYSMKEKSSSSRSGASYQEPSCELCGFEFENRKALASHARAHLRQLGIMEWKVDGVNSPIELLSDLIRKDPVRVAAITRRYRMGDLYIKKAHRAAASPSLSTDSDSVGGLKPSMGRENVGVTAGSSRHSHGQTRTPAAHSDAGVRSPRGVHPPKRALLAGEENRDSNSQQPSRSGSIPAMLPKPPLTPLVKLVGKVYSLKCRFCEEVFHGPLSVQERWITHLQKHILSLGYKGKESPPAAPVAAPALVHPVAV